MTIENAKLNVHFEVTGKEDFEKWIAEHDKQVRAEVIDEMVDFFDNEAICVNNECIHINDECSCVRCIAEQLKENKN